jgi:hypothetical protein
MGTVSVVQILLQQGTTCCMRSWFLLVEGHPKTSHYSSLHIWGCIHVCFWEDQWAGPVLKRTYPRLASYSRSDNISVFEVMQAADLDTLFVLPLSQQALEELEELQAHLQNMPDDEHSHDHWTPTWGNILQRGITHTSLVQWRLIQSSR